METLSVKNIEYEKENIINILKDYISCYYMAIFKEYIININKELECNIDFTEFVLKTNSDDNSKCITNNKYRNIVFVKYWEFNFNVSRNKNLGDLSTSALNKLFYELFKLHFKSKKNNSNKIINTKLIEINNIELNNNNNNNYKLTFDNFTKNLQNVLNDNLQIDNNIYNIKSIVDRFVITNNYIKVFLNKNVKEKFITNERNNNNNNNNNIKYKHELLSMQPIGTFYSCFPEKFSTPRQGCLLEKTKGKIVIDSKLLDVSCLDGIDEFEYFWIIYYFHLHKDFKGTKINPPKKNNANSSNKLGIFATRTPHRINSIGLTLVKLDKVKENVLYIKGIDMINETPILDIKPYHHLESIKNINKYPDWILNADKDFTSNNKNIVKFSNKSIENLKNYIELNKLEYYTDYNEIFNLIKELLEIDPHSKYSKSKQEALIYAFYIDKLNVIYEYDPLEKEIYIHDIKYVEEYKKLRTKEWLYNYKLSNLNNNK